MELLREARSELWGQLQFGEAVDLSLSIWEAAWHEIVFGYVADPVVAFESSARYKMSFELATEQ